VSAAEYPSAAGLLCMQIKACAAYISVKKLLFGSQMEAMAQLQLN
jgi:hypothetical protein